MVVDAGKRLLGGHRIRHYGLLASASCKTNIARARELMAAPAAGRAAGITRHGRSRRHYRSSPAVSLLRRTHDHRRGLWVRRRTARPALWCRQRGFEPMTKIHVVSGQQPSAGTARSRRRPRFGPASASAGTTSLISPRSGPRRRRHGPVRNHQPPSALTNLPKTIPRQRRCPTNSP